MNEAVQEVGMLLRELAGQLGTTVEQLWPSMVRAVWAEWVGGMVAVIIMLVVAVVFARLCKKLADEAREERNEAKGDMAIAFGVGAGCIIAACIVFGSVGLGNLDQVIAPEATAAKELLSLVRGGGGGGGCR